jgi:hypothetical protein
MILSIKIAILLYVALNLVIVTSSINNSISAQDNTTLQDTNNITLSNPTASNGNSNISSAGINITQIVGIVGAIIAGGSAFASLATYYYRQKEYKLNALNAVFNHLNTKERREAWEKVYQIGTDQSHLRGQAFSKMIESDLYKDYVEVVRTDFEQVGALVKNKLIDGNVFLDVYGSTVVTCWETLKEYICLKRTSTNSDYMGNFEFLANNAYRRGKRSDIQD